MRVDDVKKRDVLVEGASRKPVTPRPRQVNALKGTHVGLTCGSDGCTSQLSRPGSLEGPFSRPRPRTVVMVRIRYRKSWVLNRAAPSSRSDSPLVRTRFKDGYVTSLKSIQEEFLARSRRDPALGTGIPHRPFPTWAFLAPKGWTLSPPDTHRIIRSSPCTLKRGQHWTKFGWERSSSVKPLLPFLPMT
eukprot:scaffold1495_cov362-Pavlova_lutheri.AAC.6